MSYLRPRLPEGSLVGLGADDDPARGDPVATDHDELWAPLAELLPVPETARQRPMLTAVEPGLPHNLPQLLQAEGANSWSFIEQNLTAPVPEPSTYAMTLAAVAYGGYLVWRRRKRA